MSPAGHGEGLGRDERLGARPGAAPQGRSPAGPGRGLAPPRRGGTATTGCPAAPGALPLSGRLLFALAAGHRGQRGRGRCSALDRPHHHHLRAERRARPRAELPPPRGAGRRRLPVPGRERAGGAAGGAAEPGSVGSAPLAAGNGSRLGGTRLHFLRLRAARRGAARGCAPRPLGAPCRQRRGTTPRSAARGGGRGRGRGDAGRPRSAVRRPGCGLVPTAPCPL